jgi:cytochrome c oxidase subunit IV
MDHDETKEAGGHAAHDEHIAHTMEPRMLIGVWGALMFFTVLTVWCAQQGLGSQMSFTVAMIIATIKSGLVMSIFMHLWWDKRLNLFVFLGCFLFVLLFIGMSLADKSECKPDLDRKLADEAAQGARSSPATNP